MATPQVHEFEINIRDPSGRAQLVRVNHTWTVRHVKQQFSQQTGIPMEQFRLIFAGQQLQESRTLEEFGLQSYSTLHCVRGRALTVETESVAPTASVRDVERLLGTVDGKEKAEEADRFFVYCKTCAKMRKGKLRVRCANCRNPAFILSTEPQGWEDVLMPRRLLGQCDSCSGTRSAEFYFKCAEHEQRSNVEEECVALHMIRFNTVKAPCASCFSDEEELVVVFDCQEQHVMCIDCFKDYCCNALASRSFKEHGRCGYTLQCPAHCEDSYISEIHHFRLMSSEEYDRYHRFGTEECVLQMGGVLCPRPNCGMGILPEGNYGNRIQCPECRFVFCRECKSQYHTGACSGVTLPQPNPTTPGQVFEPEQLQRARWNDASRRYISQNESIKKCPQCRVDIEKAGGCMHMTCAQCRFEFCWICLVAWNPGCQSRHWFGER